MFPSFMFQCFKANQNSSKKEKNAYLLFLLWIYGQIFVSNKNLIWETVCMKIVLLNDSLFWKVAHFHNGAIPKQHFEMTLSV